MTTPAEMSTGSEEHGMTVDARRRIGYTINSMANTPYRQLQYWAKICGIPCNLKKEMLKMAIKAKMNGQNEEVKLLLKRVREERLFRKKQRTKALERSKAMVKCELSKAMVKCELSEAMVKSELLEENNNEMKSKKVQETSRQNKVKELMHNMIKMRSPNVTIQKTSTHTHYRALITPSTWRLNKCLDVTPASTSATYQNPETIRCNPTSVIKYTPPATAPVVPNHGRYQASSSSNFGNMNFMNNSNTATGPVRANQCNTSQFDFSKASNRHSYVPGTAMSVRETLLQQYHMNPVCYEPVQQIVDNTTYNGGVMFQHPDMVNAGYQPLPNFNSLAYNHQDLRSIQPYNKQIYNPELQTSEISCCQPKVMSTPYQAIHQYDRIYGGFQHGIQNASTSYNIDDNFVGAQNSNAKVLSTDTEAYAQLQHTYSAYNSVPMNNVSYQNQLSTYETISERVSPNVIDVTDVSPESEDHLNTDLRLLANMAMTKTQEAVDQSRSHQHNQCLLKIDEGGNRLFDREEPMTIDSKPLLQDIPTWNNFLEQMSNNLSPGVTNKKAVLNCKYGCYTPATSRLEQLKHEEQCSRRPAQCPLVTCTYVGQLGSITTHILNVHNCEIRSSENGSFLIDFSTGKCSFEQARSLLRDCPKKFCFPQLVNGRLFLINVIGIFDGMQVAVYAQYVNDNYNWKSQVACEVVRQDGVPYQFTGEVHPLTFNPMHIISRRKCLVFSMDLEDWSKNIFVLHTKICNQVI